MVPHSFQILKFDKSCSETCFSCQNFAEDKLREELRKLQEDKCQYQGTAKESLRKMLQEKLEAVQKMQDLERYLYKLNLFSN
jgi:bacterioferritin-associated ferredoxin